MRGPESAAPDDSRDLPRFVIFPGSRHDRCYESVLTHFGLVARLRDERARALADPVFAGERLAELVAAGEVDAAELTVDDLDWSQGSWLQSRDPGELLARLVYDPRIAYYQRGLSGAVRACRSLRAPAPRFVPRCAWRRAVRRRRGRPRVRRQRARSPGREPDPDLDDLEAAA